MTAASPPVLIAADGLAVGRGTPLLAEVSLQLRPGECWFLLGRNGVGKSTLVATLLGLLPPLAGRIAAAPAIEDRSGLGFVPQEQRFPASLPLSVQEFVELGLPARGLDRRQRRQAVTDALAAMHVAGLAAANSGTLSLGQRRRVLVARALARRPQLLVLDEAGANLDPYGSEQLGRDLEVLCRRDGLCLLHVCHDLGLTRRHASHVALAADGRVRTGPAAAVLADPATAAALGLEAVP